MSTILVAAVIIAIAVIPAAIFVRLHRRREKARLETLLAQFNNAGVKHNLSFTHRERLKDKLVGLDAHEQKMLVFPFDDKQKDALIDLADLEVCTVYREYNPIVMNDKKGIKPDRVLAQMGLNIVLSSTSKSLPIAFYDSRVNSIYEVPELENVAKEWKGLLANLGAERSIKRA